MIANAIIANKETNIEECFQGIDVDCSKFEGSVEQAKIIASFISSHVKKDIPLRLVAYGLSSPYHHLKIVGSEDSLMIFRPNVEQYDLKNIYHNDELIVKVPHHELYFYYINELVKNITFSKYLMMNDDSYDKATKFNNIDFCKRFNVFTNDDYTGAFGRPSIEDTGVVYRFPQYSIFVSIKPNPYGTTFCFSGRHGIPISTYVNGTYFKTFHELICHMNKYIYENIVEKQINIPAHEFTVEHRELMKMIAF